MAEINKNYCNACGRELKQDRGILSEDALFVKKDWGYFSEKDLQTHEFILCESCYDEMTKNFKRQITMTEKSEALS